MAQPAQPPAMPPVPPLGQADGAAVWGAFGAFKARQHHGGLTASQSGDDLVTLIRTAEAAAGPPAPNFPGIPANLQQTLAQLQAGQAQTTQTLAQLQAGQAQTTQTLAQLQTGQAQLQAGQAQLLAQIQNMQYRARNAHTHERHPGEVAPLVPLVKVHPPNVGTQPPHNTFPPTWRALEQLGHAKLNALAAFYGQNFGAANAVLASRRQAFGAFIKQ